MTGTVTSTWNERTVIRLRLAQAAAVAIAQAGTVTSTWNERTWASSRRDQVAAVASCQAWAASALN